MAHGETQAVLGLGRPATNVPSPHTAEDNDITGILQDADFDGIVDADMLATNAVGTDEIAADAVTKAELAGGFMKATVASGVDETGPNNIPATGMAVGDEVVAVLVFTTEASLATMISHAGTFTAAADGCTAGTPVDNTSNQYIVIWLDLT